MWQTVRKQSRDLIGRHRVHHASIVPDAFVLAESVTQRVNRSLFPLHVEKSPVVLHVLGVHDVQVFGVDHSGQHAGPKRRRGKHLCL